jgi:hypothetical protein
MRLRKIGQTLALVTGMAVSGCNIGSSVPPTPDLGGIQTQAAALVATQFSLQQTQTAAVVPPTALPSFTPLPTSTTGIFQGFGTPAGTLSAISTPGFAITPLISPAPTQVADPCHQSAFVADITIPDGEKMRPGEEFMKAWQIKNTGTCIWDDGYRLKYLGGRMGGHDVPIDQTVEFVKPDHIQEYHVDLVAPEQKGEWAECWRMQDDGGWYFGTYLCVKIVVE